METIIWQIIKFKWPPINEIDCVIETIDCKTLCDTYNVLLFSANRFKYGKEYLLELLKQLFRKFYRQILKSKVILTPKKQEYRRLFKVMIGLIRWWFIKAIDLANHCKLAIQKWSVKKGSGKFRSLFIYNPELVAYLKANTLQV